MGRADGAVVGVGYWWWCWWPSYCCFVGGGGRGGGGGGSGGRVAVAVAVAVAVVVMISTPFTVSGGFDRLSHPTSPHLAPTRSLQTLALLAPGGMAVIIDPGRVSAEGFEGGAMDAGLKVGHYIVVLFFFLGY